MFMNYNGLVVSGEYDIFFGNMCLYGIFPELRCIVLLLVFEERI